MKILLIGEFSGLYSNLKEGLLELGHEVHLASDGDGYKKFQSDIKLVKYSKNSNKFYSWIKYFNNSFIQVVNFKGYDVVHMVYDHLFTPVIYNNIVCRILKANNKMFFLTVAGSNATVMKYWLSRKDSKVATLFKDAIKHDGYENILNRKLYNYERLLTLRVDGIIPVAYEYSQAYKDSNKLLQTIPIPINCNNIEYKENTVNGKIVFFHGLNKYGFKGTKYIEKAFEIIKNKYPDHVKVIIKGNLSYEKYLRQLQTANVVLDQTSSYSLGINGLISMAMGKVVMGGAEQESINEYSYTDCPVFNLKPNVEFIVSQMEELIRRKSEISKIGYKSRIFVEKYHNHINIASKYIDVWDGIID